MKIQTTEDLWNFTEALCTANNDKLIEINYSETMKPFYAPPGIPTFVSPEIFV